MWVVGVWEMAVTGVIATVAVDMTNIRQDNKTPREILDCRSLK